MKNLNSVYKKFKGVDAVLIQTPYNTFYLTGYKSDFAFVLLTAEGNFYITDSRYIEEAKAVIGDGAECIAASAREIMPRIKETFDKVGAVKIGFENSVSYDCYAAMRAAFQGRTLLGVDNIINELRAVKTPAELSLIKKAAAINDKAFEKLLKKVKEGVTERQLAYELEYNMRKLGADDTAFDTIVAFGANTSKPHAHGGLTKLEKGMPITIDFGCRYKGYCSDITRSFAFGRPDDEYINAYDAVLKANKAGIKAVTAGASARHVDGICREQLRAFDLEKYFLHGTGHGVGVEIHEAPTLNPNSDEVLKKNMVVTVEPGIYIEGKFGVRVEDLLVVENDGCRVISRLDKKLLIL